MGDFILVNKYAYGIRLPVLGTKVFEVGAPERGDIMVFIPPHDSRYFIKRVIGLPGDHIRYENKALYINGQRARYEFVREFHEMIGAERGAGAGIPGSLRPGATHHPPLSDGGEGRGMAVFPRTPTLSWATTRDRSDDSRRWKFVSEAKIVGKAVAIWVHKAPGLHWPTFERNRWI